MTPHQARQKWCPFTRVHQSVSASNPVQPMPLPGQIQVIMPAQGTHVTINRYDWNSTGTPANLPSGTTCLAEQCMAWRSVLNDTNDGHCGLAGFQPHGG